MYEKTTIELPGEDGTLYKNFEECFGSRFAGEESRFRSEDKALIKTTWTKVVQEYYAGLRPVQRTKLIKVGTGRLVTAVPVDQEHRVMALALLPWQERTLSEMFERMNALNISGAQTVSITVEHTPSGHEPSAQAASRTVPRAATQAEGDDTGSDYTLPQE